MILPRTSGMPTHRAMVSQDLVIYRELIALHRKGLIDPVYVNRGEIFLGVYPFLEPITHAAARKLVDGFLNRKVSL